MLLFYPFSFLWTSVGLRESFIIAEIAVFLAGLNFLFQSNNKRGYLLLFLGSYGLVSTKNYLWACLMIATLLSCIIFVFQGVDRRKIVKLLVVSLLLPTIAFASTTSAYALEFIFGGGITEAGERSGDSISQVYVEVPVTGTGTGTGTGTKEPEEPATGGGKELITFHGDYTLIALRFYLIDHPNSLFTKIFKIIRLDKKLKLFGWKKLL